MVIRGGFDGDRIWAGAVWRPPPGKRGALLHQALCERRTACILRLAGCRKREVQFSRFLRNPSVTPREMICEAVTKTAARVAGRDIVVTQDTSELSMGGRWARQHGYGPIGKGGALRGLLLHVGLAVEVGTGAVVGLVDAQVWNRDRTALTPRRSRATTDKESQRWIDGAARAGEVLAGANSITVVSDQESDFYEHLASHPVNVDLLVRAHQDRRIETDADDEVTRLLAFVEGLPEQGRYSVNIPAAPGRKARVAELAIRFAPVTLCRPKIAARHLPKTIDLTIVDVREVSPPPDVKDPIHWRLLTTHKVSNLGEARKIVDFYRLRWTIEEFFRTLKTASINIEDADIGDPRAMMNLVTAAAVASVSIMQLVKARDGTTEQVLEDVFEPGDQPILEALSVQLEGATARQKNPHAKRSLAFGTWVIARLGGWTGYYRKPGPKVISRGLYDFQRIKYGAELRL